MTDRLEIVGGYVAPELEGISLEDLVKSQAMPSKMKGKIERRAEKEELQWLWSDAPPLFKDTHDVDLTGLTEFERGQVKSDAAFFGKIFLEWTPHSGQAAVLRDQSKIITIAAGRRWGKSESMAIKLLHTAITRPSYQHVLSITQDQTTYIFNAVKKMCLSSTLAPLVRKIANTPFPYIEFVNDSSIKCYSTNRDGDYIRGAKSHRIIIDEASRIPDTMIDSIVMPMLLDYNGQLILISTPAGHNDFYRYWEMGQKDAEHRRYSSYRFSTYDNPYMPKDEIEEIKKNTSEIVFKCEYLAEFLADKNFLFKWASINRAVDEELPCLNVAVGGRSYVMGVDIAKMEDFTVVIVLDDTDPQKVPVVYFERFNNIEYGEIVERIKNVLRAFQPHRCVVDATGAGNPVVDYLLPEFPQVEGYTFTNTLSNPRKFLLMDQLRLGFEQNRVRIFDQSDLVEELKFYEYRKEDNKPIQLSAQVGKHDDCVCALALAWSACSVPVTPLDCFGVEAQKVTAGREYPQEAVMEITYPMPAPPSGRDYYGPVEPLVPDPWSR